MRILLFADIHIGSIKDIAYVYNTITDIIDKEIIFKKTDMVVILGDYFDHLFKVNDDYVTLSINIMSYLIRACSRSNTIIRMIYGTESHEMNQYGLFGYHLTSDYDIKLITTVTEECIDGKKILYIPEEYVLDKHEYYKDTLYSNKEYDYIFGHGMIIDALPSNINTNHINHNKEKRVPYFGSGDFKCNICVFGHYHCHANIGNVYYLGSLFRNSFGEETPKGYGIIENDEFIFVENDKAYKYKTYEYMEDSPIFENVEMISREINRIKKENEEIFNNEEVGKIRLLFHIPKDVSPTVKEQIYQLVSSDRNLCSIMKNDYNDTLEELKESIDDEYEFILDNSLKVHDKIHRYITKYYNYNINIDLLKKYIYDKMNIEE